HDDKIEQERDRNSHHVQWHPDDLGALHREHYDDREEQQDLGKRAYLRDEVAAVPGLAFAPRQNCPGCETGGEGHAQVDADALRDSANRYVHQRTAQAEPTRYYRDENISVEGKKQHLKK